MLSAALPLNRINPTSASTKGWMYWVFVLMVFLYPVWPVFIEKKIGPLPSLTPQKLLTYVLVGLCLLQLAFSRHHVTRLRHHLGANQDIVKPLLALLALKLLSCALSVAPFHAFGLFYYETLTTVGILFIALTVVGSKNDLAPVFKAMLLSALVIGGFSLIEAVAGKNLLEHYIPAETGFLALIDKGREGVRRLQGTFASPLLLAEFSLMMIPIILLSTLKRPGTARKIFLGLVVALMLAAIYGSRTRSALGLVLIGGGLWTLHQVRQFLANPRNNTAVKCMVAFYGGIAILGAAALAAWGLYSLAKGYSIDQTLGLAERTQTLYQGGRDARLIQLEMAIPKIISSPLWGYGVGIGGYIVGFVGTNNMITLDSHLMLTAVDSGLPAMLLSLWIILGCSLKAIAAARTSTGIDNQWLRMIGLSLGGVAAFMAVSPLSDLFPLAFVLIGCLMIIRARKKEDTLL